MKCSILIVILILVFGVSAAAAIALYIGPFCSTAVAGVLTSAATVAAILGKVDQLQPRVHDYLQSAAAALGLVAGSFALFGLSGAVASITQIASAIHH